jgi:hypothetical protein
MTARTFVPAALAAAVLALAACNSSAVSPPPRGGGSSGYATPLPTNPAATTTSYVQIERWGRPAVKEVFENFNDHKTTNAVEPYAGAPADPLQTEIKATEDTVRPPSASAHSDYGAALQSILYPDAMAADLSDSTDAASYLGIETGGATGGKFGGRAIKDDIVTISLGAMFGNTLAALKVEPEDGEENGCLTTDNVAIDASQQPASTFPYLSAPH